jgi:opacity protein-like surface antigen
MKKRVVVGIVLLALVLSSVSAFAAEKKSKDIPWLASFNSAGNLDLSITGGYSWYGLGVNAGAEFFLGQFDIGPIPLSWGVAVQGSAGFDVLGIGIGAAALPTLNLGFDFGGIWKFEESVGLGLGITYNSWGGSVPFGIGIAQTSRSIWWFSNNLGLTFDEGYINAFLWGSWYFYGVGVTLKL